MTIEKCPYCGGGDGWIDFWQESGIDFKHQFKCKICGAEGPERWSNPKALAAVQALNDVLDNYRIIAEAANGPIARDALADLVTFVCMSDALKRLEESNG